MVNNEIEFFKLASLHDGETLVPETWTQVYVTVYGLPIKKRELVEWCRTNCSARWAHLFNRFYFESPNDAIQFKLVS